MFDGFNGEVAAPDQEAGYDGVVVYVSESRPGSNFGAKPVIREYADDLRAPGQVYPLHPGHQTGQ